MPNGKLLFQPFVWAECSVNLLTLVPNPTIDAAALTRWLMGGLRGRPATGAKGLLTSEDATDVLADDGEDDAAGL